MKLFEPTKPNLESVLQSLIKSLNVRIMPQTVAQSLQDHPEYPSLLAISDCLTEWNIENQVYRITKEDYDVDDLLFPFIAHLPEKGGRFILVNHIEKGNVNYSDEIHQGANLPEEEFLKRWDGIALHAEKNINSGEKEYRQNRIKYMLQDMVLPAGLILIISVFCLVLSEQPFSWPFLFLSFIKFIGLAISVLLLIQSINSNNPFIQNLCGLAGKNDCNAILKSDAAKVTSWLSWSEVGFFYFAGSILLLLLNSATINLLAWLNLLALPYTFYSITYQYRNKNWCILCCSIQALLWLECFVFLASTPYTLNFSLSTFYLFPLCFLFPIIIWAFLKPFFLQAAEQKPLKQQLKKFKYNSGLFNQILKNQPRYAVADELMPIVLGNPNAETIITMVSNLFCGPCGKAHETLDEWLKNRDDIQLKVVFTTANHDDDKRTQVARHVTALSLLEDKKNVENALNDWYQQSTKKYEDWAEKYPVRFNGEMNAVTEKQKAWCEMAEITFTPTILINGYKLPEPYRLEDLKYLIG